MGEALFIPWGVGKEAVLGFPVEGGRELWWKRSFAHLFSFQYR